MSADGKLYHFWLDWDKQKQDYSLGDVTLPDGRIDDYWGEVDPEDHKIEEKDPYYQLERKNLGLPYDRSMAHSIRKELVSLLKKHEERYPRSRALPNVKNKKLQKILSMIDEWNNSLPGRAQSYLHDKTIFRKKELEEAHSMLVKLFNNLTFLAGETRGESNEYHNWASSLSELAGKLSLLTALEGKEYTISSRNKNHD